MKSKISAMIVRTAYQHIANSRQFRNGLGPNGATLQKEIVYTVSHGRANGAMMAQVGRCGSKFMYKPA